MLRVLLVLLSLVGIPLTLSAQQSIGIFTGPTNAIGEWDPESKGLPGSEESVVFISQELADLGYQVVVFGSPPATSRHCAPDANPRWVRYDSNDGTVFDVAIAWRLPYAAQELRARGKSVYLWPWDTLWLPVTQEQATAWDDVLWVSDWQREQWVSVNPAFAKYTNIFYAGIMPEQFQPVTERKNPYSCIYGSNYARGLEVLLDVWPKVKERFPQATLDIYYGWQSWGDLSPATEAKLRDQIAKLPGVQEHGRVDHETLNRAYERSSFWTYPCTYPETFCITALRAQLCGAVPVIIDGSNVTSIVRGGYHCKGREEYLGTLLAAMEQAEKITIDQRQQQGEFIRNDFTWKAVAARWKQRFDAAKTESP
jgi:glycosyltransferase involved in cell wall biosynthesis